MKMEWWSDYDDLPSKKINLMTLENRDWKISFHQTNVYLMIFKRSMWRCTTECNCFPAPNVSTFPPLPSPPWAPPWETRMRFRSRPQESWRDPNLAIFGSKTPFTSPLVIETHRNVSASWDFVGRLCDQLEYAAIGNMWLKRITNIKRELSMIDRLYICLLRNHDWILLVYDQIQH